MKKDILTNNIKLILFIIIHSITIFILIFSNDYINLILNAFILIVMLNVYFECDFCPSLIDTNNNKNKNYNILKREQFYKNTIWIFLTLTSLKFCFLLLYEVLEDYCNITDLYINIKTKLNSL
jgi:hypothetical protein